MASRAAAIVAAGERVQTCTFSPFNSASLGSLDITFKPKLTPEEIHTVLALTRTNMEAYYNAANHADWAWNDEKKRKELAHSKSRFILMSRGTDLIGFASIRILVDAKRPVVYVYELQVEGQWTSQGLGKHLMGCVEDFCHRSVPGVKRVVLTCLVNNTRAIDFYKKLGFRNDETHVPGQCYAILSKPF